ncbi:hypothetical protein [Aliivibrio fischeri]|uniref:hypothetical protein n=1 Tax=Aliivibrio fischeri TaxID=668 RepID=UPI0006D2877E|nr:hypothetical protein [Aliivibrio fischeri]USR98105.1 hypothetical protein AVFI_16750 [Aliivibrio fischeri ATCC 7744 = JCM 18803 = DSM 507]GGK37044.1 hypothetical protein GCM10007987_20460 [Aliivibrio fischeri]
MSSEAILSQIESQDSLEGVNAILTDCMANQSIQGIIKGNNLHRVLDVIIDFATDDDDPLSPLRLKTAASLGRLAAVARSRQSEVYAYLPQLFNDEPCDFEMLADGDEKHYAAQSISHVKEPWVMDYCLRQAVLADTAENARRTLIQNALVHCQNLNDLLNLGKESFTYLSVIDSVDTRMKRARRITRAWSEIIKDWNGDVGENTGKSLASWLHAILMQSSPSVESSVMIDIVDDALAILIRTIELRFSNALLAETYQVLEVSRNVLSSGVWSEINKESEYLPRIKTNLKEAALVLARQNRTDSNIMKQLAKAYYSKAQVIPALKRHFSSSQELDPQVKEWWLNGGKQEVSTREPVHAVGNSEDQQIGSLLIQVETSQNTMEKLERAVVPFLEISDPPLASTVKKASSGFGDMSRIARQLARMRKLTHTDNLGQILEYNPLQHEMLGGHQYGIRKVRVVRDGIQKEFGGKIKTLVKPWVEAVENQDDE